LILVDPGQGYSCGEKPDAEAVKNAWVARCEQRRKYGPDGANPCEPPTLDGAGRYAKGKLGDVCNDPHALVDPNSDQCAVTFAIDKPFGTINVQQVIVLVMNKIGGPIIVLPSPAGPEPPRGPGR
jgi:hypothetical protein